MEEEVRKELKLELHLTTGLGHQAVRCQGILSSGLQCSAPALSGVDLCRVHGGLLQKREVGRVKEGQYKEGKAQRYKIRDENLNSIFQQSMEDPELLSLRSSVALIETRIVELVKELQTDATQNTWANLKESVRDLQTCRKYKDSKGYLKALQRVEDLVEQGAGIQERWNALFQAIDRKKEVSQAEWKRLLSLRAVMTADRALELVTLITDAVLRQVRDPQVRGNICVEVQKITHNFAGQGPRVVERELQEYAESFQQGKPEENPVSGANLGFPRTISGNPNTEQEEIQLSEEELAQMGGIDQEEGE